MASGLHRQRGQVTPQYTYNYIYVIYIHIYGHHVLTRLSYVVWPFDINRTKARIFQEENGNKSCSENRDGRVRCVWNSAGALVRTAALRNEGDEMRSRVVKIDQINIHSVLDFNGF